MTGPLVWYQQFEYAIGHWFQKATEHVFGCVLCSPGCFSLFRGSALLDDNVMKRYAETATEASHYIQYDQGTKYVQADFNNTFLSASQFMTRNSSLLDSHDSLKPTAIPRILNEHCINIHSLKISVIEANDTLLFI